MSDTTPLKGLPSRPQPNFGSARPRVNLPNNRPTGKKEGGVKLLDITEQPMGYAAAKKRKRQQEMEEAKRVAEEAAAATNVKTEPAGSGPAATPDYAANLPSNLAGPGAVPPPAYAPPTPAAPAPAPVYAPAPAVTVPLATPQAALPGATVTVPLPTQPLPQAGITRVVQLPTQPLPQGQARMAALSHPGLVTAPAIGRTAPAAHQAGLQPGHLVQLQQGGQQVRPAQFLTQQAPQILRQVRYNTLAQPALLTGGRVAAGGAGHPGRAGGGPAGRPAEKPFAYKGPDAGGAGDVPHRQQGHPAGEGAHPWLHGRLQVRHVLIEKIL